MKQPPDGSPMIEVFVNHLVYRDHVAEQYIHLLERHGQRGFLIVIGKNEAMEIHRVLHGEEEARPFTHKLAFNLIDALGYRLVSADIVDLRHNTFHALLNLEPKSGGRRVEVDSRPSDAIPLALRAGALIRVSESVLEQVRTDRAKDKLDGPEEEK